jgi:hypothetical protein
MKKITNWNVKVTTRAQFKMVLKYIKTLTTASEASSIDYHLKIADSILISGRRYVSYHDSVWNYSRTVCGYECFSSKTRITWDEFLKMSGFTGELNDLADCVVKNDDFETLKDNQQITLFNREYEVRNMLEKWWLSCRESNSIIFKDAGIEYKFAFQKEILGYCDQSSSSEFPECETAKDLTKLVNAIKNYKKQTQSIKIDSYEVEIVSRTITKIASYTFTKDFWEAAVIITANTKAAVFVGCDAKSEGSVHKWQVTQETIGKILKAMESK